MFIVLSVVSKDVVDLWEAVITFLMFPLVVVIAFLVNKCIEIIKKMINYSLYRLKRNSMLQANLIWQKKKKHLFFVNIFH